MLKFLLRTLIGLAALFAAALAGAYFLLQDPNRFKPEIEAFIAEQTGAQVDIGTNLSWELLPPLGLSAAEVSAEYQGARYDLSAMRLDLDLMSVIRTRDIDQWQVTALTLEDLEIEQEGSVTHVQTFRLDNFKPRAPSPFAATLTQHSGEDPPLPLELKGSISVDPAASRASLTDTWFETTAASGVCNLDATMKGGNQPPDPEDAIIPVSLWRTIDWSGSCNLDRLTLLEEDFDKATVSLENAGGKSTTSLTIPEFFEGSASATVDIDASNQPVRWRIVPDLARADSTAVMQWLDQRLKWIAPLAYSGEITMTGNTTEELVQSVKGKTTFDGGKGRIDIAQIKQPLLNLATLFEEPDRIAAWPDLWDYERLIGEWVINGTNHQMDFALDNLTAAARGDYDPIADALDMKVEFLFEDNSDMHSFDVNPVLVGLPIPLKCTGSLEAPKCSVTAEATRNLVAAVLTSEQGSKAREKIDEAIEEKVPEEYREAARGLLDLLGDSLKQRQNEEN
jgi:hypothetical protein